VIGSVCAKRLGTRVYPIRGPNLVTGLPSDCAAGGGDTRNERNELAHEGLPLLLGTDGTLDCIPLRGEFQERCTRKCG
jgi:hypothetical protein